MFKNSECLKYKMYGLSSLVYFLKCTLLLKESSCDQFEIDTTFLKPIIYVRTYYPNYIEAALLTRKQGWQHTNSEAPK